MDVKKVKWFKYATWNIRGLGGKGEELDKILNENNIQISVITESKKKLQGTKEIEHYTVIYSGVDRHTKSQPGVMIWIHKSISKIFQSCVK
jgi:exonuclease III